MSKERLTWIDICKGIGILTMILGHIGFGSTFDKLIHAFHLPVFFVVSGYLFGNRTGDRFVSRLQRKSKSLLLPYLLIGVFHYAVWLAIHFRTSPDLTEPLVNLMWINTNNRMPIAGALWFLTCLFWVDIMFFVLHRQLKNRYLLGTTVLLLTALGMAFPRWIPVRLPWALDAAFVGLFFYYLGFLLRETEVQNTAGKMLDLPVIPVICLLVVFAASSLWNAKVNMRTGSYAFPPWTLLNAAGISILLLNLSRRIRTEIIVRPLSYVGRNSITFLCFNQLVIDLLRACMRSAGILTDSGYIVYAEKILLFVLSILVLCAVNAVLIRTKLKIIIGQ